MFKVNLGAKVKSRSTGLVGITQSRSENLYGCNRYYIQPPVLEDMKVPDGYWIDEEDIEFIEQVIERNISINGGPLSKVR